MDQAARHGYSELGTCLAWRTAGPAAPRAPLLTLLLQESILPLEVINILLVCVVFPSHILDILCGFV